VPTTAPGVRLPSILLPDGVPIFDRLGQWFTLVCVGRPPGPPLLAAAARRGIPLDVLKLDTPTAAKVYGYGLLMVRPDQHIVWRDSACDDSRDADAIISRVLGWDTLVMSGRNPPDRQRHRGPELPWL
jgi:hypothetical protein